MIVKRQTLTNDGFEPIVFDTKCQKFLVKNFSNSDIYVSTNADATTNTAAKLKKNTFETIVINERLGGLPCYDTDTIYAKGTGEIEVQQLCYTEV